MNPVLLCCALLFLAFHSTSPAAEFESSIQPLLSKYCLNCHSTEKPKGELDLERFKSPADVRNEPRVWVQVLHQFDIEEMPPEGKPQPTKEERARLIKWIEGELHTVAMEQAGDPGPVVLRRLNNAEYTYTIQDLTGVALEPAREFPVDGAAGEGFLNTGASLSMSPSMVDKQLAAAKEVARHVVLTPTGMRFSDSDLRGDWVDGILDQIRAIYLSHTGGEKVDFSYREQVVPATPRTAGDGRLDVSPYLQALSAHRGAIAAKPEAAAAIAKSAGLNARYAVRLARELSPSGPNNPLFNQLRKHWNSISDGNTRPLAAEFRRWQDQLWKFQPVGHFGRTRPWLSPKSPLVEAREIAIELKEPARSGDLTIHLFAGTAGDGAEGDAVVWRRPRIVRKGRPDILLRDLRGGLAALQAKGVAVMRDTEQYLAAAFELRGGAKATVKETAAKHRVDPVFLELWLDSLGIVAEGAPRIPEYLHEQTKNVSGHAAVNGWRFPGQSALSLVANSSDQFFRIPGDSRPGQICVHPMPDRWVAAGWLSPYEGEARIVARVRDAHNNCGNGISWRIERRRGQRLEILASGDVDLGKIAEIAPIEKLTLRKDDLLSLVILARDRSHVCDLTQIDLEIHPSSGSEPEGFWSLSKDCAPDILSGNPHADRFGNEKVWHFYTGRDEGKATEALFPPDSLVDRWMNESDAAKAAQLAKDIARLLAPSPLPLQEFMAERPEFSKADERVRSRVVSLHGPFFSKVDLGAYAKNASPGMLGKSEYGLDPALFDDDGNLRLKAPQTLSFKLPAGLVRNGELVTVGALAGDAGPDGSVQLDATLSPPATPDVLHAHLPIVIRDDGRAGRRFEETFAAFRDSFPAALCFSRVVPTDEVVTLLMFHREDGHLARLMLNDAEKRELDRLWEELEFVSLEPRRMIAAYEQLWQFESQLGTPKRFEHLEAGIREAASRYEEKLIKAEPAHLDALLEFVDRAWRRPLKPTEKHGLLALYHQLRGGDMSHEEAFRLTLARALVAPAFLYKAEKPFNGDGQGPVNAHELATRLSYFLWSSAPDAELRAAADSGALLEEDELLKQTRRMLRDSKARRLAIEFACQWLHLRGFDEMDEKSGQKFPEFAELKGPMYEEVVRFFADLLQNNGSILSVLDADHTFVNHTLAEYYGLEPAAEKGWRRVGGMKAKGRGGILGQAAALARQSGASRTSPILRGNWIVETLLGERLPQPPAGVPVIPDDPGGPELNMRELTERHSRDPACIKCHQRIDPFGYALEQFDAIGGLRPDKRNVKTRLPDGAEVDGLGGLREYLLTSRRDQFVEVFCKKLLGFALGRSVQLSDEPLMQEIQAELAKNDFKFSVAVEKVVTSRQFREIRGNGFGQAGQSAAR